MRTQPANSRGNREASQERLLAEWEAEVEALAFHRSPLVTPANARPLAASSPALAIPPAVIAAVYKSMPDYIRDPITRTEVTASRLPGCWIWTGGTSDGAGRVHHEGRYAIVHRILWEAIVGDLRGQHLHSLCGISLCVNVLHRMPTVPGAAARDANLIAHRLGLPKRPKSVPIPSHHPYRFRPTGSLPEPRTTPI